MSACRRLYQMTNNMMTKMITTRIIHPRTANTAAAATVPLSLPDDTPPESTTVGASFISIVAEKFPYPALVLART